MDIPPVQEVPLEWYFHPIESRPLDSQYPVSPMDILEEHSSDTLEETAADPRESVACPVEAMDTIEGTVAGPSEGVMSTHDNLQTLRPLSKLQLLRCLTRG